MSQGWYDRHILPHLIDLACGMKPVRQQREKVVPQAKGCVLEVGIGTGLNMPYYDQSKVTKITGLDPAVQMHRLAHKRIARAGLQVEIIGASAEEIPLDDASFDTVLLTLYAVLNFRSWCCTEGNAPRPRAEWKTDFLRARSRAGRERLPLAGPADAVLEEICRWVPPQPRRSGNSGQSWISIHRHAKQVSSRASAAYL